jgi:pSer/pThr/pTyr-binding forkhead associated (FHA) protein
MISEKFCPVCHNLNKDTAFICATCSSALEGRSTDLVTIVELANLTAEASAFIDTALIPEGGVAVYSAGAVKPFYLSIDQDLILGRQVGEIVETMLDLTELAAYNMGVSRRHALIRRVGSDFEVLDLASRNGTWLNAIRLVPNKPYPFANGSHLRLAQLQLLIMYNVTDNVPRKK